MNNQSININLCFKHTGQTSGKKSILSIIDQYLEYLEDISESLVRHFGFILDGNRRLRNISSDLFEYHLHYRLIPPLQMFLDNEITMDKIAKWLNNAVQLLVSGTFEEIESKLDLLARDAELNNSFFYVPFPSGLLEKRLVKFKELTVLLGETPTIIDHKSSEQSSQNP